MPTQPHFPPSTQPERIATPQSRTLLNRLSLCVLAVVAIACQAQSPSVDLTPSTSAHSTSTAPSESEEPIAATPQTTYESSRLGIQFAYPDGFVVDNSYENPEVEPGDPLRGSLDIWSEPDNQALQSTDFEGTELPPNVLISVYNNPDRLPLQDWIEQSDSFVEERNFTTQQLAGQEAIAFESSGLYEYSNVVLPNPDGSEVIVISLAKDAEGYQPAFESVLATFEFN